MLALVLRPRFSLSKKQQIVTSTWRDVGFSPGGRTTAS